MIKKIAIITLTSLTSLLIIGGAIMKIVGVKSVTIPLTKVGVGPYIPLLGAFEIIFAILFLIPITRKLGLLLLSAYFGGAMATHLSHGENAFSPAPLLVLIWIVAYLKDSGLFITNKP